jgi:valyl-tRNA synthetase
MKIPQINELMIMEPVEDMIDSSQENVLMMTGQPAKAYDTQDHLAHIQSHLDFYQNPVFGGGNPLVMPALIQPMVTHIQEHFGMWYQSRMNEYVEKAMRGKMIDYDNPEVTPKADKLYALASQHVQQDSEQTFARVMPIFQQIMQQIQQLKQQAQPPMDADAQALVQTSMAETQRRAKKDETDAQIAQAKLQADQALSQAKLKADADKFMAEKQLDIAMSAEDNLTKERIESAKLTHEGGKLQHEQVKTALGLENQAQNFLGGQNV